MAILLQFCVLFLMSFVTVKSGISTGKAFFCKDPDTGKLHSVNSTWQSTTFCGNYTCKLQQKTNSKSNHLAETEPFINITNVEVSEEISINNRIHNNTETVSIENKKTYKALPLTVNKIHSSTTENKSVENKNIDHDDKNRYLTESEIKTISEILHSVKKSDLDAIVDVYKLAQDIYKEIDAETTANTIVTSERDVQGLIKNASNIDSFNDDQKHISYWYEPLNTSNKGKSVDMQIAETNTMTAVDSKNGKPNSYFKGNVVGTDLKKGPYYYPITDFQNMHPFAANQQLNKASAPKEPIKNQSIKVNQINGNNIKEIVNNPILKNPYGGEYQKMIQPSILLPYPFSNIHHYNISSYPYDINFDNYPWIRLGLNKKNYPHAKPQKQIHNNAVLPQVKEIEKLDNPLHEPNNILVPLFKKKINKKPDWQTEQLAAQVLEEIKANIAEKPKLKAFTFRKNVKLDRVGKVIKLDEFRRSKRDAGGDINDIQDSSDAEMFEVFLERTTCQTDMQPGFFRVGNLSQPYPDCCPQRIKKQSK